MCRHSATGSFDPFILFIQSRTMQQGGHLWHAVAAFDTRWLPLTRGGCQIAKSSSNHNKIGGTTTSKKREITVHFPIPTKEGEYLAQICPGFMLNYYRMEGSSQTPLHSIRQHQRAYERQIRQTYKQHTQLFVNHSSDQLHLEVAQKQIDGVAYPTLIAKTGYQKYDCIAEVRGSVIRYDKLRSLVEEGRVEKVKLPVLLYLNAETKYLLSPKNITKYLFGHPCYRKNIGMRDNEWSKRGNCSIQNHYGFKLLVTATRDIPAGEELILEQRTYDNLVYSYNSFQL